MIVHAYKYDPSEENGVLDEVTEYIVNTQQICTMRYVDMYIGDFVEKNGVTVKDIVDDRLLTEITMSNGKTLYVTETIEQILEGN